MVVISGQLEAADPQGGFPYKFPDEKPDRPLSAAMDRAFDLNPTPHINDNELYTQFKYTKLEGLDYNGHDGTISLGSRSTDSQCRCSTESLCAKSSGEPPG